MVRLEMPIPSAPAALPIAISARKLPEPSCRLSTTRCPPTSSPATVSGSSPAAAPVFSAPSTMVSATFNGMLTWSRWTKWSVAISAPVELHRVVDQELLLQLRGRRDLRDHVGDDPVVRGLLRHVRMRPVGAPDHPIREALH